MKKRKRRPGMLEHAAYYDELCGCSNLPRFKIDVQEFISSHPDETAFMVKFDIREFKLINRILGEKTGDQILVHIASVLRQVIRPGFFCRAHDDEFYVFAVCDVTKKWETITQTFMNYFYEEMGSGFSYRLKLVSGRCQMSFETCKNAAEAVEKANIAHSKAKELGLESCEYDEEFIRQALWKKEVENKLEPALERGEFVTYLQAQYNLADETVNSAEALVRWEKGGRLIPPDEFIPILEENGLIIKLDFYVFEQVCRYLREWQDQGYPQIETAVNFSRKHLAAPDFVQRLCKIADRYRIPYRFLVVELTETDIWENEEILFDMAEQLHRKGFLLAMDDFGTGYSSFSLLKNLPVDILKLDRRFFTDNRYKTRAKILISCVMSMANQLGMVTVAEGVEEQEQIEFLREVGCEKVQGYYYERPLPIERFRTRQRMTHRMDLCMDMPFFHSIGDVKKGRGILGEEMPVKIYRLFQFSLREALTKQYGEGEATEAYRSGGRIAGRRFAREYLNLNQPEEGFLQELKQVFRREKIGDVKIQSDLECEHQMVITVSNDLGCSGLEDEGTTVCQFDEGFLAGILYEYTHKIHTVSEIDCWANGSDACRFIITNQETAKDSK